MPTFPATLPLAGTAFVAMLQLTLVGEGWPLHRLRPLPAGLLALALSWIVAVVVYLTVVEVEPTSGSEVTARHGPVPGAELGAVLVLISAWQVLGYVSWRGWPFATIDNRAVRLTAAHVTVLGGGILTFFIAHRVMGFETARIAAVAGCFIAAGLVFGMLLEDWLTPLSPRTERTTLAARHARAHGRAGDRAHRGRPQLAVDRDHRGRLGRACGPQRPVDLDHPARCHRPTLALPASPDDEMTSAAGTTDPTSFHR